MNLQVGKVVAIDGLCCLGPVLNDVLGLNGTGEYRGFI